MSHLTCLNHGSRVHVLEHGIVMHRSNAQYCDDRNVTINDKVFQALDVAKKGVSGATELNNQELLVYKQQMRKLGDDFTERLTRASVKVAEALSEMGEKLREGNTAARLLHTIFAKPDQDIVDGVVGSLMAGTESGQDDEIPEWERELLSPPPNDYYKQWLHTDED